MRGYVPVSIVSDDDGHKYLIPTDMVPRFYKELDKGYLDYFSFFNSQFSEYRVEGKIPQLYIKRDK